MSYVLKYAKLLKLQKENIQGNDILSNESKIKLGGGSLAIFVPL